MTLYDPVSFWNDLAPHIAGPGAATPEHERQEAALESLLSGLEWESVCEIGVGRGRISDLLRRVRPSARYTGVDIGDVQLDAARRVWPDGTFERSAIEDFDAGSCRWDLVIACEVLMHVVPEHIEAAVANVLAASRRHVVVVEWVPLPGELDKPVANWNFPHDYVALLGHVSSATRTDRQMIYHVEVAE